MKKASFVFVILFSIISILKASEQSSYPLLTITEFDESIVSGAFCRELSSGYETETSTGEFILVECETGRTPQLSLNISTGGIEFPSSCYDPSKINIVVKYSLEADDEYNIFANSSSPLRHVRIPLSSGSNQEAELTLTDVFGGQLNSIFLNIIPSEGIGSGSLRIDEIQIFVLCDNNPFNQTLAIEDNQIKLTDGCGTLTAELPEADCCDKADELITDFKLDGNTLIIEEGGNTHMVDLSSILAALNIPTMNHWFMFLMGILVSSLAMAFMLQMHSKGQLIIKE